MSPTSWRCSAVPGIGSGRWPKRCCAAWRRHAEGRADRLPAPSGRARRGHRRAHQPAGLLVRPVRQHRQVEVRLRLAVEAALDRRVEPGDGPADQVGELRVVDRHAVNANLTTTSRQLDVDRLSGGRLIDRDHPFALARQLWIAGARPRTLPAAVAPVLAGTGAAAYADAFVWWKALLALGVSLSLQIGVNYANDYSDGIKGTDDDRVGPLRLVGSGLVPARSVKRAALLFLALGGAFGFALAATSSWWLLLVGVAAIGAAWTYTGGPVAVRLSRARRGQRLRVLRPRRGARHGVRADRGDHLARRRVLDRRRRRWPARSSSPTTCATSRPTRSPARRPSRSCWATPGPGGSTRFLLLVAIASLVWASAFTLWALLGPGDGPARRTRPPGRRIGRARAWR